MEDIKKEKHKDAMRKYYLANRQKLIDKQKEYYHINPQPKRAAMKRYTEKNKTYLADKQREYYYKHPEYAKAKNAPKLEKLYIENTIKYVRRLYI